MYFQFKEKNVLEKYDEEIAGAKKEKFQLGSGGKFNTDPEKQMDEIRRQLREQSESLGGVSLNPINEYLTPQELAVSRSPLLHAGHNILNVVNVSSLRFKLSILCHYLHTYEMDSVSH